jgi:hypothetical protein
MLTKIGCVLNFADTLYFDLFSIFPMLGYFPL